MLDFKLPEVGENIKSGTVVKIFVSVGDVIQKNQDLLELETNKASLPVPSPCDGTIKEILVKEGQDVKIGSVVMKIEESASVSKQEKPAPKQETPKEKSVAPAKPETSKTSTKPASVQAPRAPAITSKEIPAQKDVPAAPSVRRLARELGIDISLVPGSGPGGRISEDDVKAYTKQIITSGAIGAGVAAKPLPDFTKFGLVERKPMNNIRKKTAEHLTFSWNTIPHVTQFDKADATELEKTRKKYSTAQRKLTITPFLLKIMTSALKNFPQFNAALDLTTHEIIYKKYYNIGVAVNTERGLLVPVIRDVDQKNILQLTEELNAAAERARNKKTTLDELQGGSMTLTNLGGLGGTAFTPIINWPEVCILGVSRASWEPVFEKENFVARFKLPLSLSYDHRLIDGVDAARFLRWICEAIEQPFLDDDRI